MDFPTILLTALGILILIFIPGFCLSLAIFPKRKSVDIIERLGLSFLLGLTPAFSLYFLEKNFFVPVNFLTTSLTFLLVSLIGILIWWVRKGKD